MTPRRPRSVASRGLAAGLAAALTLAACVAPGAARAAKAPPREATVEKVPLKRVAPLPPLTPNEPLPEGYGEIVRRIMRAGPADTLGNGLFFAAEAAYHAGSFDAALGAYGEFSQKYPRNLAVNDALDRILLIRGCRDFDDAPLRLWARAEAFRDEDRPDSAAVLLHEALRSYPGAAIRYHCHMALAEIARDRGDHPTALAQALMVADTSATTRLAPYALRLAGDETLASGAPPDRAAHYYQALLERFPDSPLVPGVRTRLLALRKKMQL